MPIDTRFVLSKIKEDLEGHVGERIRVKANKGRKRIIEREGTLEKTYPNLFVVKLDEDQHNRRVSFTYADVLTEVVEITVCAEKGHRKLEFTAS